MIRKKLNIRRNTLVYVGLNFCRSVSVSLSHRPWKPPRTVFWQPSPSGRWSSFRRPKRCRGRTSRVTVKWLPLYRKAAVPSHTGWSHRGISCDLDDIDGWRSRPLRGAFRERIRSTSVSALANCDQTKNSAVELSVWPPRHLGPNEMTCSHIPEAQGGRYDACRTHLTCRWTITGTPGGLGRSAVDGLDDGFRRGDQAKRQRARPEIRWPDQPRLPRVDFGCQNGARRCGLGKCPRPDGYTGWWRGPRITRSLAALYGRPHSGRVRSLLIVTAAVKRNRRRPCAHFTTGTTYVVFPRTFLFIGVVVACAFYTLFALYTVVEASGGFNNWISPITDLRKHIIIFHSSDTMFRDIGILKLKHYNLQFFFSEIVLNK